MKDQRPHVPYACASPAPDRCPRCGAANRCALVAAQPIEQCWCRAAPARLPLPAVAAGDTAAADAAAAGAAAACYCPACLQALGTAIPEAIDAR